jgi:hypothetical protein
MVSLLETLLETCQVWRSLGCVTISSQRNLPRLPQADAWCSHLRWGWYRINRWASQTQGAGTGHHFFQSANWITGRRSTTGMTIMIPKFVSMKPDSKNSNCHSNCHHWHHLFLAFLFGTHRTDPLFCGAKKFPLLPKSPNGGAPSSKVNAPRVQAGVFAVTGLEIDRLLWDCASPKEIWDLYNGNIWER